MSKKPKFVVNPALLVGGAKYAKTPRNNFPGMERRLTYGFKKSSKKGYDYREKDETDREEQE